jgi:hypothetical protein
LLHEKLKTWWDEYQEWRKEGRHLKRRKMGDGDDGSIATGNQTPAFAEPDLQVPASVMDPSQVTPQHQHTPIPTSTFALGNAYPTPTPWGGNELGVDTSTQSQPISDQAAFTTDMGDFSAAFQNGDLYLWNDMTADNFGGWVTQGGSYGGTGFGGMNSHGF